ncbi:MAG: PotD/PotF family extracellular solute-binding protein [Hyphomicrobiales bacterium]
MNELARVLLNNRLNQPANRRRFLQGAAGLATLTVLGAPREAKAGELGGPLNFFGYDGEQAQNVAKPFLEKNNIQLNASFAGAADETLTRFNTGGRGSMDIMTMNKDFQRSIVDSKTELFQALDMSRIPNAEGLFPAFKSAAWLHRDGKTYGIPMIWGDEPCIYNPAKWKELPPKYTGFADPKYKGELVLLDDPFGNIWLFAKSLGMPEPSRLTQAQLDEAFKAMLSIKPNVVTIGASLGDMADVLVRGDASIGLGGWAYQLIIAKQKGVTLALGNPVDDGTFYWSDAYTIAVDAPHLDNAYAFFNFVTSAESNAALATELGSGATVEKAFDLMDPAARDIYNYETVRKPDGGVLGTQIVVPPQTGQGDIVPASAWVEAWQTFKAS